MFRRRSGLAGSQEADLYERQHSEETFRKMADLGVNLVMLHFDKGAGLAELAEEIEHTRRSAELCHQIGIRVGAYIRYDTILWETLYREMPELASEHAVAWDGQPAVYANQPFRYFNCPTSEPWLEYLETRTRFAIEEIGVDLIHYDGFSTGNEGATCACDRCRAAFHDHLLAKYGDETLARERFGHSYLDVIGPPKYHPMFRPLSGVGRVRDPALQEWIDFRTNLLARIHERLSKFITDADPDVAMEVNALVHTISNAYLYNGVDLELLADNNDILWTEDRHHPRIEAGGIVVSRAREFKVGKALRNGIFSYIRGDSERDVKLCLAQSFAFSRDVVGHVGAGTPHDQPFWDTKRRWLKWWRERENYFIGSESAAEVGVWRSRASLALNCDAPYRSAVLLEQVLLQSQIPFDIVLDRNLGDLSRYRALIIPNVESMSREQAKIVEDYIRRGGGIVVTEESGHFDHWGRQRPDSLLREIIGDDALSPVIHGSLGNWPSTDPLKLSPEQTEASHTRREVAKGRVVYIPEILPGASSTEPPVSMDPRRPRIFDWTRWSNPANHGEIADAIRWAAGGSLGFQLTSPPHVICEHTIVGDLTVAHLVNFSREPAEGLQIRLALPAGNVVGRVVLDSPESGESAVDYGVRGGRAVVDLPPLDIYQVVSVETAAG